MAAQWVRISEDSDIYDLRYETAQDDRVRKSHASMQGATFPATHDFWDEFYPPNGWGCRCDVVQVPKLYATDKEYIEDARKYKPQAKLVVPQGFQYNVGKTGQIFPDWSQGGKGYFDVAKMTNVQNAKAEMWGLPPSSQLSITPRYDRQRFTPKPRTAGQGLNWIANWMGTEKKQVELSGMALNLDIERFRSHVFSAKRAERANYIHLFPELLAQPHEVFFYPESAKSRKLYLLRYYDNGLPLLAIFDNKGVAQDNEWRFNTFYTLDRNASSLDSDFRKGILITKK